MKTEPIPAIVTLTAGLVTCIVGIVTHMETARFTKVLLLVLVIFFVIGSVAKIMMDRNFKEMSEDATEGESVPEDEETGEETEQAPEQKKEEHKE